METPYGGTAGPQKWSAFSLGLFRAVGLRVVACARAGAN
jgi:hypothetical protein